jgi:hypothetical protein
MKYVAPCYYRKSCGYDLCFHEDCPEYKPKKRGEPYYGDEEETEEAKAK